MLDKRETMRAYKARLRTLPAQTFYDWFDDRWISSFDIRSTITTGQPVSARFRKHYAIQAFLIACEKGARPKGVTTEHKHKGQFVCPVRQSIQFHDIRYIGRYSHFSGHKLKREENPFALQPQDKRYCKVEDRSACLVYNLRSSIQSST
jgi:hypothetical protein